MDVPIQGPANPATSNPNVPIGQDPNATLFAASIASPTGAAVQGSAGGANTYYSQATPTSSVVSSSTPFQTQVTNTGTGISTLPPTVTPPAPNTTGSNGAPTLYSWTIDAPGSVPSQLTPDLNGVHTAGYNASTDQSVIAGSTTSAQYLADQQQRTALQQQRDQEIQNLTTQQGIDVAALNTTQANETGGDTRNLLAMGGYLGNNSFSNSYLSSLQVSHEQAMQTLNAKYTSAIQAAQNAYTNNDFAAADKARSDAAAYIKAAQDANTEFLNQTDKIQTQNREQAAQTYTEGAAQRDATKAMADFIQKNATGKLPFAMFGGSVMYASGPNAGQTIDPSQFAALGVDQSTVEQISDSTANSTTDTKNYAAYAKALTDAGGKPVLFGDWMLQQKRAGAANTFINTGGPSSTAAIDNLQKILDAHPNDWQGAADAFDQRSGTFKAGPDGKNTVPVNQRASTMYDSLFKQQYQLPSDAQSIGTFVNQGISSGQKWDQAAYDKMYEKFKNQTLYITDDEIRRKVFDAAVPKVGSSKAINLDPATINAAIKAANGG